MEIRLNLLLLLLLSILSLPQSYSQTSRVYGEIVDEHQNPLGFANVLLLSAGDSSLVKGDISGVSGEYEILSVPEGRYVLMGSMVGYKKAYSAPFTIDSQSNDYQLPALLLAEDTRSLEEVVVKGERPFIERKPDRLVLNVQNSIVAGGSGSALEILEKAPGITLDRDGKITLRGKQGVIIMVDGRPSNLSAEDVENLLKNISGSSIEQIEIITNPSAKYDAAGNAGIINIITRKSEEYGLNGTSAAGWEYGRFHKYNAGLDLNYRRKWYNIYGNYTYSNLKSYTTMEVDRIIEFANRTTTFDQNTFYERVPRNHFYKLGMDFFLGENDVIGILFSGFSNTERQNISNETFIRQQNKESDSTLILTNQTESRWSNQAYNLNYKKNIRPGKELTADLDYSLFRSRKTDNLRSGFYDYRGLEAGTPFLLTSEIPSTVEIKSFKSDYSHALTKTSKLELGVKASLVSSDNLMQFNFNQDLISYLEEINHFKYSERINAAYVNFHKEFGSFNVQLGLRAEQTSSEGNSVTASKVTDTVYLQFFPSLLVSQAINDKNELSFSYSRRIDRPGYQTLNPFIYFLDLYTNFQGNPFLRPQNTHSFELSHALNNSLYTTAGFSHTNNVMTIVIEQNDSTKVSGGQWVNLDQLRNYSLTFSKAVSLTKWWSANNNLNGFYNHYSGKYLERDLDNRLFSLTLNTSHTFSLPCNFRAEVSWFYNSPMAYGIERMRSSQGLNVGIRKSFLEEKAVLNVVVNDIFNTMRYKTNIDFKNMDIDIQSRWESRTVRVSLSYLFGKKTVKSSRERNTGIELEKNRVSN